MISSDSPCLVHGDFDGSNILVKKVGGQWQVSGVVDWEYAISATPLVDLGHILRPPFGDIEPFERNLIEGFMSHGGILGPRVEARVPAARPHQLGQLPEPARSRAGSDRVVARDDPPDDAARGDRGSPRRPLISARVIRMLQLVLDR